MEHTTVPFKGKETSLLAFVEEQEGWMVENSLEWPWCSTVIQALYSGCDITEEASSMAQEVLTSKRTTKEAEPTEQPPAGPGDNTRTRLSLPPTKGIPHHP